MVKSYEACKDIKRESLQWLLHQMEAWRFLVEEFTTVPDRQSLISVDGWANRVTSFAVI